ncbi:MAG TPA: tryptophan synthase subunit alpha [Candidatus Saccharimonadales bacterium]|nr:tryptophan synthase subunit alpha [Candidatus Saccharimonadales bacterium]
MANKLMCHVVAGYPSERECIALLLGMQKAGIGIIEVQIPFSDPIADGETIMRANDRALDNGMNIEKSFKLISAARKKGLTAEIYIMSYVQKLLHYGIADFCRRARGVGVKGLIIPDLPYDSPEYGLLTDAAKDNSLHIVPVISPGMSTERLKEYLKDGNALVYLTSTKGITGNRLNVSEGLDKLCQAAREISPGSKLAIGFGVQSRKDVTEILKMADIAVVGSTVIREVEESGIKGALNLIKVLNSAPTGL